MAGVLMNANMVDHLVSAPDELHESEVSQFLMFSFAAPENSYSLLMCSFLLCCAYKLLCTCFWMGKLNKTHFILVAFRKTEMCREGETKQTKSMTRQDFSREITFLKQYMYIKAWLTTLSYNSSQAPTEWSAIFAFGAKSCQDTHNCLCAWVFNLCDGYRNSDPQFELFDIHADGTIAQQWQKWIKWIKNLFVDTAISDKKRKHALLLYYARKEVSEIFDTLPDTSEDFETAKMTLNMCFDLKKNVEIEIFTFQQARQNPGETMNL